MHGIRLWAIDQLAAGRPEAYRRVVHRPKVAQVRAISTFERSRVCLIYFRQVDVFSPVARLFLFIFDFVHLHCKGAFFQ